MSLYRKLISLRAGCTEKVDLPDALRDGLIPGARRGKIGFRGKLSLHERCDIFRGAQVIAPRYEQIRPENDIFVFHDIIGVLLDRVELSGTDDDDIAGCDRALLEIRGHDASAFFYYNKLHFRVPVQGARPGSRGGWSTDRCCMGNPQWCGISSHGNSGIH